MPEPVWYYARGEVERGPFTSVQIKALANAGKLRPNDMVWTEGMENWTEAEKVSELFPNHRAAADNKVAGTATPAVNEAPAATRARFAGRAASSPSDLASLLTLGGRACLFIGVLCVVCVRGCESLGDRKIAQLTAAAKLQELETAERERQPIEAELKTLQARPRLSPGDQDRFRELTEALHKMEASRAAPDLPPAQQLEVNRANAEFRSGTFVRGVMFHLGIFLLVLAGFALVIWSDSVERWLGVGVLLIICFSALSTFLIA